MLPVWFNILFLLKLLPRKGRRVHFPKGGRKYLLWSKQARILDQIRVIKPHIQERSPQMKFRLLSSNILIHLGLTIKMIHKAIFPLTQGGKRRQRRIDKSFQNPLLLQYICSSIHNCLGPSNFHLSRMFARGAVRDLRESRIGREERRPEICQAEYGVCAAEDRGKRRGLVEVCCDYLYALRAE